MTSTVSEKGKQFFGRWPNTGLYDWSARVSIRIGVGSKTSGVGGEFTTQAEAMTFGWGCTGACPTWEILKIWTSLNAFLGAGHVAA